MQTLVILEMTYRTHSLTYNIKKTVDVKISETHPRPVCYEMLMTPSFWEEFTSEVLIGQCFSNHTTLK